MKKGFALRLIIFLILTLFLASLVYIFVINKTGNTSKSEIKADYSIPTSLIYQSKNGWTDINGDGWTISVKNSWKLAKKQNYNTVYFGLVKSEPLLIEVHKNVEGIRALDRYSINIPNSTNQILEINHKPAAISINTGVFQETLKEIPNNNKSVNKLDLMVHIGVQKNNAVRTMVISTSQKFFSNNKEDFITLISSLR